MLPHPAPPSGHGKHPAARGRKCRGSHGTVSGTGMMIEITTAPICTALRADYAARHLSGALFDPVIHAL
jgi:hypothetical protein